MLRVRRPGAGFEGMSEVSDALARLAAAVERLERAAAAGDGRIRALTAERDAARAGEAKAARDADEMSRRLEAAIGRLEAVLES